MKKDIEKLFSRIERPEPPAGLFDRVILAIRREQELRNTKKLAFGFLTLLVISLASAPFSWSLLASQIQDSGVLYFVSAALSDIGAFFAFWQNFGLAIVESLPIAGITVFVLNLILAVFTVRLFFHKKRLLLRYLMHNFS